MIVDESLQAGFAIDRRPIVGHYVADANTAQPLDCFKLRIAGTRRIQKKPTNECQPESAESRAIEKTKQSDDDKSKRNYLPDSGRDARSPRGITRDPPDTCAQHPATIKGKSRHHIEHCQSEVDYAEPAQHRSPG